MSVKTVRRIASEILNIGENKIKIKISETSELEKVKGALTREDVRGSINKGIIYKTRKQGVSRAGVKKRKKQKKKGRQKGPGKRRGSVKKQPKKQWMARVRLQRKILSYLSKQGLIDSYNRNIIYYRIKGGAFRSKAALISYLNEHKMVKEKIGVDKITKAIRAQTKKPKKPKREKKKMEEKKEKRPEELEKPKEVKKPEKSKMEEEKKEEMEKMNKKE